MEFEAFGVLEYRGASLVLGQGRKIDNYFVK